MVKHYQSNTPGLVTFRLTDVQAMLLQNETLCMLDFRGLERSLSAQLRTLVDKGFLKRQAHPEYFTRTEAGSAALFLFQHFGGIVADRDKLR